MLGYIHACFSRRAAQEVRNDPRFATWGQPPVPRRALSVYSFRKYFVGPIDHVDL
jgi:hypothetical protein